MNYLVLKEITMFKVHSHQAEAKAKNFFDVFHSFFDLFRFRVYSM